MEAATLDMSIRPRAVRARMVRARHRRREALVMRLSGRLDPGIEIQSYHHLCPSVGHRCRVWRNEKVEGCGLLASRVDEAESSDGV